MQRKTNPEDNMEKKLIIVPDVHGRTFWKQIKKYKNTPIVFLGDYLDPYTSLEGITSEKAIENFKDILRFARENRENVTLLYGNHDSYAFKSSEMCSCRHDWNNIDTIEKLFDDNEDLFKMAYDCSIEDKHFLLTHAGVNPIWIQSNFDLFGDKFNYSANELNSIDKKTFTSALCDVSRYRGGYQYVGSMVWSDIQEYDTTKELSKRFQIEISDKIKFPKNLIQICGHTWCEIPISIYCEDYSIICIDVQKIFYIDENAKLGYLLKNE